MADFVISHCRAGKRHAHEHHRARAALADVLDGSALAGADIHGINQPGSDQARHVAVFSADPAEIRAREWHPELIVEPRHEHWPGRVRPPEVGRADAGERAADAGSGREVVVRVRDAAGRPAANVDVFVYLEGDSGPAQLARRTGDNGEIVIAHAPGARVTHVAAVPHAGAWPLIADSPGKRVEFRLAPLPAAEAGTGWWHRALGLRRYAPSRGRGIRVGVIDTGVGPHAALDHVHDLGVLVDARNHPDGGRDLRGHGSHVAGVIGARPVGDTDYGGLAPAATLYSLRVFGDTGAAHQGDIALALWEMAHERGCHLVNLSLGTASASEIERDAIIDAADHGCLTVSAAGNTCGAVEYPAAFDEALAVTALGLQDWGPAGSLPAHRRPADRGWWGPDGLYLANFCCTGPAMDCAAPGVGIISTVPGDGWAAYGGTSTAAPQVTGLLAALLSRDSGYKRLPAGRARADAARGLLIRRCRDLGLAPALQGAGMPVSRRGGAGTRPG